MRGDHKDTGGSKRDQGRPESRGKANEIREDNRETHHETATHQMTSEDQVR